MIENSPLATLIICELMKVRGMNWVTLALTNTRVLHVTCLCLLATCTKPHPAAPLVEDASELHESRLALISQTPYQQDQSITLFPAPLPEPCEVTGVIAKFCASPIPLTMARGRYELLKQKWGVRKERYPSRVNVLSEVGPKEWRIMIHQDSEHPLSWWDPNFDGSLRLWPVLPTISQTYTINSKALPGVIPDSGDTLRIDFSKEVGRLQKWSVEWSNSFTLSIMWTPPTKHPRILIDPGHGGDEVGTSHHGLVEKDLNLIAANYLKSELVKLGAHPQLTRDSDQKLALAERLERIDSSDFDFAISLHHDWVSTDLFPIRPACFFSRFDVYHLAQDLCTIVSRLSERPTAASRRYLFVNQSTKIPSIVLEILNLQDPSDLDVMQDKRKYDVFLSEWSRQSARIIVNHLHAAQ